MRQVWPAAVMPSVICWSASAEEPKLPIGLYSAMEDSSDGAGPRLDRADAGGSVTIGTKLCDRFDKVSLVSESNDNSRYRLSMSCPVAKDADLTPRLAIVVAGKAVLIWGHSDHRPAGLFVDVDGDVVGQELAEKIADELRIKPQLRKHPGYQWQVSFAPEKESYQIGDAVSLKMTIKNVGQTTFAFMDGGMQRGRRNNQFQFVAFGGSGHGDPVPDLGDPRNFGGLGGYITLKPGDVFTKTAKLDDWFKFIAVDTYRVTGMFRVALHDPQDTSHTLWDDFAVGECTVRIDEPKAQ
jgi:hypothetical protein